MNAEDGLVLLYGQQRATVIPRGGALGSYEVADRRLVETIDTHRPADSSHGAPLLPWPGRIGDGRYDLDGRTFQLPITEVDRGNAIHGLTLGTTWQVDVATTARVVFATTIGPQPGYPFRLSVWVTYSLDDGGLTVTTLARNDGQERLPYGAGHHPYVLPASGIVDHAQLRIPATLWHPSDARGLPLAERTVSGTDRDFRSRRSIGDVALDTCYSGFDRDDDGRLRITLDDTVIWMDRAYRWAMIYTGDTLAAETRRRRSVAVEPMTCPPDAFRTGVGLIVLDPGQAHVSRWGIEPATEG